jgi:hypothetical protein
MNFKDVLQQMVMRPDQIKLSTINKLDTIEDVEFRTDMANFLVESAKAQLMGILCISAYQSNKKTFLFSRRILEDLVVQAHDLGMVERKTVNSEEYKAVMNCLYSINFIEKVVQGEGYNASLFEIIDPDFSKTLVKKAGSEFLKEQKNRCIELHRQTKPPTVPPIKHPTKHPISTSLVTDSVNVVVLATPSDSKESSVAAKDKEDTKNASVSVTLTTKETIESLFNVSMSRSDRIVLEYIKDQWQSPDGLNVILSKRLDQLYEQYRVSAS